MNILIKNILDALTTSVLPMEHTVDKLEYGDPYSTVEGIAVTFLASQEVIVKAKALGANLIISHEGIFYSHWDKRDILRMNPVYQKKHQTIEESKMAVYRFHDNIHNYIPDGIMKGLLQSLGWQNYEVENQPEASIIVIPEVTLQDVIYHVKNCLGTEFIRFIGDTTMPCKRIGLLVGYRGGEELTIPLFEKQNVDLVIYGEGPEWETPEYVRDAIHQGSQKALIVLGHAESEVPGMKYLTHWLQEKFPCIPVHFIPQEPIFRIL